MTQSSFATRSLRQLAHPMVADRLRPLEAAARRSATQITFCVRGVITDPCPVPLSLTVTIPSSRTPALSHFWIRRMMRRSPMRCSTNLMNHSWLTVEERADVGVQYPVHLCAGDPDQERI